MSHTRIVRFGQPVDPSLFIDHGPSHARLHGIAAKAGPQVYVGGTIVSGESGDPRAFALGEAQRKRRQRQRDDVLAAQLEGRS